VIERRVWWPGGIAGIRVYGLWIGIDHLQAICIVLSADATPLASAQRGAVCLISIGQIHVEETGLP